MGRNVERKTSVRFAVVITLATPVRSVAFWIRYLQGMCRHRAILALGFPLIMSLPGWVMCKGINLIMMAIRALREVFRKLILIGAWCRGQRETLGVQSPLWPTKLVYPSRLPVVVSVNKIRNSNTWWCHKFVIRILIINLREICRCLLRILYKLLIMKIRQLKNRTENRDRCHLMQ